MAATSSPKPPLDADADADGAALDDDDDPAEWTFGYPLQRMVRSYSADSTSGHPSPALSESAWSSSSSIVYNMDFEALVDDLLRDPAVDLTRLTTVEPKTPDGAAPIMVKRLPRDSTELLLLLQLNHADLRADPWNPAPHILCAVERGADVFLCLAPLLAYDAPPFKTVANYIDFLKQTLEGLTFLHEHGIAQLSCGDARALMVDIGVGTAAASVESFDRAAFPVRYYCTDFSRAARCGARGARGGDECRRDVMDFAVLVDRLIINIPRVGPKLKALAKSMSSGEFSADDARKLLEALCKSFDASVFETPVPAPLPQPTRAHTK